MVDEEEEVISVSDSSDSSSSDEYTADPEELDPREEDEELENQEQIQNHVVSENSRRSKARPPPPSGQDRKLKNVDALLRFLWVRFLISFWLLNLAAQF